MLTPEQVAALRLVANADPAAVAMMASADDIGLAAWFNEAGTFIVWRTQVAEFEYTDDTSGDGTTFSWSVFIARSQGERDGWRALFGRGHCDPSKPNVRQAFDDIFSGGTGGAQRTHMAAISKRAATRAEQALASGTGTSPAPGTLSYEGQINFIDASRIRSL